MVVIFLTCVWVVLGDRSDPDNQPDRDRNIVSVVGEWEVVSFEAGDEVREFSGDRPSFIFDAEEGWTLVESSCWRSSGSFGFDGDGSIAVDESGTISFRVIEQRTLVCELGPTTLTFWETSGGLATKLFTAETWDWTGKNLRIRSSSGTLTLWPLLEDGSLASGGADSRN